MPFFLKKRIFSLLKSKAQNVKISLFVPLTALFLYVGISTLVLTCSNSIFTYFKLALPLSAFALMAALQLIALFISLLFLIGFSKLQTGDVQALIWGQKNLLKPLFKGMLLSLVLYPVVICFVQIIHQVVSLFIIFTRTDQIAVWQLKNLRSTPTVFWSFVVASFTVVPLIEELLFRGFWQNYFVRLLGVRAGIGAASLLFTAFHYSAMQGMANIELLTALFFLSYLIGSTYIKEKSLFAPIGMHAAFNSLSVLMMLFVTDG